MKKNVHEIFAFPYVCADILPSFTSHYLGEIHLRNKNKNFMKYNISRFFSYYLLYRYIGKNIDYVFYGQKYNDLIKSLFPSISIVITSFSDRKSLEKEGNIFFFPLSYIAYEVEKIFLNDPLLEKKSSTRIIDFTVDFFKKTHPKFLIVSNDSLFHERFLIYCARKAGIKTICIQDGIFSSVLNPITYHGKYTDFMYVWSKKQKSLLINGGISPDKLAILGYPYKRLTIENHVRDYDKSKICILGQPFENFDIKLGERKKQIFEKVVSQFAGITIVYKPHPAEYDLNYFPDNASVFTGSLLEAIQEYDYFFSLTSTGLLEVSLAKKIAIQLYDKDFYSGVYEKEGQSYSYDLSRNMDLREYFDEINEPFPIDEDTLFIPEDIGQRFLDLEKSIQNEKA